MTLCTCEIFTTNKGLQQFICSWQTNVENTCYEKNCTYNNGKWRTNIASGLLAGAKYSMSLAVAADVEAIDTSCVATSVKNAETIFKSWQIFSPEPADKRQLPPALLLCHCHLPTTSVSPEIKQVIQITNYHSYEVHHVLHLQVMRLLEFIALCCCNRNVHTDAPRRYDSLIFCSRCVVKCSICYQNICPSVCHTHESHLNGSNIEICFAPYDRTMF